MEYIKEFLITFQKILFANKEDVDISSEEKRLKEVYYKMSIDMKREAINKLLSIAYDDFYIRILILSYLLKIISTYEIIEALYDELINEKTNPEYSINILYQIGAYEFCNDFLYDKIKDYKTRNKIYHNKINEIKQKVLLQNKYIKYNNRNKKRVVIVCRQLLGELHAPTLIIINIYKRLQELGYQVYVVINYMGQMQKELANQWCDILLDNNISDKNENINYEVSDEVIKVYNMVFNTNDFYGIAEKSVELIMKLNPAFVLSVGGYNLISDLVNDITTVCNMSCTGHPAVSDNNILIKCFDSDIKRDSLYNAYLDNVKKIFTIPMSFEKKEDIICKHKEEYGISKDKFTILLIGNRLDNEISDKFLKIMQLIYEKNPNIIYVIIGQCENLKKRIKENNYGYSCIYLGYVSDLQNTMSIGDLYLNPPRVGGGTSATYSIRNNIPILTLPNCDVASRGEKFVCKNIDEFPHIVSRYINDSDFMNSQIEYCKKVAYKRDSINSIENVRKFCNDIKNYIKEQENDYF